MLVREYSDCFCIAWNMLQYCFHVYLHLFRISSSFVYKSAYFYENEIRCCVHDCPHKRSVLPEVRHRNLGKYFDVLFLRYSLTKNCGDFQTVFYG
jgi:hypothetical protein